MCPVNIRVILSAKCTEHNSGADWRLQWFLVHCMSFGVMWTSKRIPFQYLFWSLCTRILFKYSYRISRRRCWFSWRERSLSINWRWNIKHVTILRTDNRYVEHCNVPGRPYIRSHSRNRRAASPASIYKCTFHKPHSIGTIRKTSTWPRRTMKCIQWVIVVILHWTLRSCLYQKFVIFAPKPGVFCQIGRRVYLISAFVDALHRIK